MIIMKSSARDFERPTGNVQGILVDISEPFVMFNKQTNENRLTTVWTYKLKPTYVNDAGVTKPHLVSEYVTPSLHEKSKLRARLNGLAGRKIPDSEIPDAFDTVQLVGTNCVLNLLADGERGYTRVQAVGGLMPGMVPMDSSGYVRPEWIQKLVSAPPPAKPSDPSSAHPAQFLQSVKVPAAPGAAPVSSEAPVARTVASVPPAAAPQPKNDPRSCDPLTLESALTGL